MNTINPNLRSKVNTRQRLILAAVDVFKEKGVNGATVDDLTSAAGFTRGAFYSNFSDKEEVFWLAFTDVTERGVEEIKDSMYKLFHIEALIEASQNGTEIPQPEIDKFITMLHPIGITWHLLHTEALALALRSEADRQRLQEIRTKLINPVAKIFTELEQLPGFKLILPAEVIAETVIGLFTNQLVSAFVAAECGDNLLPDQVQTQMSSKSLELVVNSFVKSQ